MVGEVPNSLVYQRIRNRVIEHLDLLMDRDAQLEYQERVPFVHVSHQLIELWCDVVDPEASKEQFPLGLYDAAERSELSEFNRVFLDVLHSTPDPLPAIAEFQQSKAWGELRDAAEKTHAVMMKRGALSENQLEW